MEKSDSLYKYTRLKHVNSVINNGIFASRLDSLNDPYENNGAPSCKNDIRIVCLSRSRNQKLMWSHYADGHRGCSIKIALPRTYNTAECPLKRVKYTSEYIKRDGHPIDKYIESLYIKDKKWHKELEVRAVYCDNNDADDNILTYWKKYRNKVFYKAEIVQIDFGCLSDTDPDYLDALTSIRDYNTNHKRKISVRKYKMSDRKYEFIIDKDFNYEEEIHRLIEGSY